MKTSRAIKKVVERRAKGYCEYCFSPSEFSPGPFAAEHVIPTAKDGLSTLDNLAYSCQGCNGHKFTATEAIDPVTKVMTSLYHPRNDFWESHFEWSADALSIIGITPTGRATVERLQLNRPNLVNLRKALLALEIHPGLS
ncbi:MAG: HNH endonuclease [Saprospiraceae bacterium]|nr:HNH endonuclease [Saprospiraceae bacterium]